MMQKYKFLPYDKKLVSRARELRSNQTEAEKIFWGKVLKSKELTSFTFLRQKPIGPFIVDFYSAKLGVAIEIDGDLHDFQKSRDKERDNYLTQQFGIKIIRFKNNEVLKNPEKVLKYFLKIINPLSRKGGIIKVP